MGDWFEARKDRRAPPPPPYGYTGIMRGFHRGSGPSASAQRVARRAQRSGADKTRYCAPVCQRLVAGYPPVRSSIRELDSKCVCCV